MERSLISDAYLRLYMYELREHTGGIQEGFREIEWPHLLQVRTCDDFHSFPWTKAYRSSLSKDGGELRAEAS
jgi:hypothetical protein